MTLHPHGRALRLLPPLLMVCLLVPAVAGAQQIVFLVRHAERADMAAPGQAAMQAQADPLLSAAGEARAARLAAMLGDAGISAVFATEYRRTRDTAQPLAGRLGLTVETVAARDTEALVGRLRSDYADRIVLLVGHSNTVPAVIRALGGPELTIADDEYDNLFVVVPATGTVTRIRY